MKTRHIVFLCLLISQSIYSQNSSDALRYSRTTVGGTARTIGVGAAYTSLGADFSVLSINPAGLATYRSSELTITPSLLFGKDEATFSQVNSTEDKTNVKFNIDNVGYVRASRTNPASNWKTSNWAVGINRIADYDEKFTYSGTSLGSITERWVVNADNFTPDELDDFETGPAYEAGAIYDFDDDLIYGRDLIDSDNIPKEQTVERDGGIYEFVVGWAGNYNEKFSIGLGMGIPIVGFEESKDYVEEDVDGSIPIFDELRFQENLTVTGGGFNLKLGTILHPNRRLRLGLSLQSPTWYALTENFNTQVGYQYTLDNEPTAANTISSPDGSFRYRLTTPWSANVGLSYLFKLNDINGFLSFAADYKDYRASSFNFTSFSNNPNDARAQEEVNEDIDNRFDKAINYHGGAELAFKKYRARAGIILEGSPFVVDENVFNKIYSLGAGYRGDRFFIDAAYRLSTGSEGYIPFGFPDASQNFDIDVDKSFNKFLFTLGFKI